MNILEHDAKNLLSQRGVPVPAGAVAQTPEQAQLEAMNSGAGAWVQRLAAIAGDVTS